MLDKDKNMESKEMGAYLGYEAYSKNTVDSTDWDLSERVTYLDQEGDLFCYLLYVL